MMASIPRESKEDVGVRPITDFKCPICGTDNDTNAKFCISCGYKFSSNDSEQRKENSLKKIIELAKEWKTFDSHEKFIKYLPRTLKRNEKVEGIAIGTLEGLFSKKSGILVLTDERILFINGEPNSESDKLNLHYDEIKSIKKNEGLVKDSIKIFTIHGPIKIGDILKENSNYIIQKIKSKIKNNEEESKPDTPKGKIKDFNPSRRNKRTEKSNNGTVAYQKCSICNEVKPVSEFYSSGDGLSDECKDCSYKKHAAEAVNGLMKIVHPGIPFRVDDIVNDDEPRRIEILDWVWTLQEHDLIEHDKIKDTYTLKPKEKLEKFLKKYGRFASSKKDSKVSKEEAVETSHDNGISSISRPGEKTIKSKIGYENKEIVYIGNTSINDKIPIILKGMLKREDLIKTFTIEALTPSIDKCIISKGSDGLFEVLIELHATKKSLNDIIQLLEKKDWIKT